MVVAEVLASQSRPGGSPKRPDGVAEVGRRVTCCKEALLPSCHLLKDKHDSQARQGPVQTESGIQAYY